MKSINAKNRMLHRSHCLVMFPTSEVTKIVEIAEHDMTVEYSKEQLDFRSKVINVHRSLCPFIDNKTKDCSLPDRHELGNVDKCDDYCEYMKEFRSKLKI